jgi:mannosylglycoprotein endo-beta-mannosidase
MCWVKWEDVCKPKKEGGLGVKNLRLMNMGLLAKWRWKLLEEGDELWKKVLMAKYGSHIVGNANLEVEEFRRVSSVWWRDICRLDGSIGWFKQSASKILGNGQSIYFWKDVWLEDQRLNVKFPRLFGISIQKDSLISDIGSWVDGVWRWDLRWRRAFFAWEETLLDELLMLLTRVNLKDEEDRWHWRSGRGEGFSVKSTYVYLDNLLLPNIPKSPVEAFAFKFIWKCGVPSKVSALAWQLILNRIPTRDNLRRRGVIRAQDSFCPFCSLEEESSCHLFLHCRFSATIWYEIIRWFGAVWILPPSVPLSFVGFVGCGSNRRRRKGLAVIWLAFVWAVWKARNNRIFNNAVTGAAEVVDLVQRLFLAVVLERYDNRVLFII